MSTPGPGDWRIGDADRQSAVEALGEHFAVGRLDQAEFEERSEQAWSAKLERDLTGLFADLPPPHGAVVAQVAQRPTTRDLPRRTPRHGGRRFPVGPLVFLVFVLAVVTHSFWMFWLVPAFLWLVVRPARRWQQHGQQHGPSWHRQPRFR